MFQKTNQKSEGQALVEFALVIGLLLLVLFIIIEGGRLFQAWLTVQNSARVAARYAITGQYDDTGSFTTPECPAGTPVDRWQVCSIKEQAFLSSSGLNINLSAGPTQPGAFGTQVCQPDNCPPEGTGGPGEPTRVSVFYNAELITPFLRPFAQFIRVTGQVEVVTAQYDQVSPGDIIIADVGSGVEGPAFPNYADIRLTKEGPVGGAGNVMEPVNYTITVKNYGPFSTPSVEVLDLLPSGTVSMTNYTITNGVDPDPIDSATCSFSQADQQLTCNIPFLFGDDVNPGTAVIDIELLIAPEDLELNPYQSEITVTNTASVFNQIATLDQDLSNNEDSVDTTLSRWYDLEVTKEYAPGQSATVNLNETVDYVISVENIGPSTAWDAVITDTLPGELQFVAIVSQTANANCVQSGNGIQCLPSPLAFGELASVRIQALVIQDNGSNPENQAFVIPSNPTDVESSNNSDTADPTVITSPALVVDKTISPLIYTDRVAVYNINVTNNGDGVANQVILTDDMQPGPGVSFDYNLPPQCVLQPNGEDIQCQGPDLAPGDNWLLQVPIIPYLDVPSEQFQGTMTNDVAVTSNGGYHTGVGDSAATTIRRLYDLDVDKTSDTTDIASGIVRYTVVVRNDGPSTSLPFTILDELTIEPAGASLKPAVVGVDGRYIEDIGDCQVTSPTINCSVASLPEGETASFTIVIDLTGYMGTLRNRATVVDTQEGDNNDTDGAGRLIYPYALEVSKSGPDNGNQVEASEYLVTVVNRGALPATFTILDVLETRPVEMLDSGVSITASGAQCSNSSDGSFDCTVTALAPGDKVTIEATVTPQSGGWLTNTVSVDAPDNYAGIFADTATVTSEFQPMADLGVAFGPSSAISETVLLQLDVTNYGPAVAQDFRITDSIEVISGTVMTVTMSTNSDLSLPCGQISGNFVAAAEVTCNLSSMDMKVTESVILYMEVVFADETDNKFTNEAFVRGATFDPNPVNDIDLYNWP